MKVEPDVLKDGADVSRSAGRMALNGADALSSAAIPAGMFGDFADAHTFHSNLTASHASHVQAMRGNHLTLTDVGDKVAGAAVSFEETEARNKAAVDTVPDA